MGSTADRIKDIGPQPQAFDIERATKENALIALINGIWHSVAVREVRPRWNSMSS